MTITLLQNSYNNFINEGIFENFNKLKYSQDADYYFYRPACLNTVSDLLEQIPLLDANQFIPEGVEERPLPRLTNAWLFGRLLLIVRHPEAELGSDYTQIAWKRDLHMAAEQLTKDVRELERVIENSNKLKRHLKELELHWESAVRRYFDAYQTHPDDFGKGLPSYTSADRALTAAEKRTAKNSPLSLFSEMQRPITEKMIVISGGCGGRPDQQLPAFITQYAKKHPTDQVKVYLVEPSFATTHPEALIEDWTSVTKSGRKVSYSNRFRKDNVEVCVQRTGFSASKKERALLTAYLTEALRQGVSVFLGSHCSPVADYLPAIYNELLEKFPKGKIVLYDEHGSSSPVLRWEGHAHVATHAHIRVMLHESELFSRKKDVPTKLKKYGLSDEEIAKVLHDYKTNSTTFLGCQAFNKMDALPF